MKFNIVVHWCTLESSCGCCVFSFADFFASACCCFSPLAFLLLHEEGHETSSKAGKKEALYSRLREQASVSKRPRRSRVNEISAVRLGSDVWVPWCNFGGVLNLSPSLFPLNLPLSKYYYTTDSKKPSYFQHPLESLDYFLFLLVYFILVYLAKNYANQL